jgi:RND family efflux transporter MFP subunit
MSLFSPWFPSLWDALGWTMLHFLWTGALVALIARFVLWAVRRRSPHVRYAAALGGFVVLALVPAVLFAWSLADRTVSTGRATTVAFTGTKDARRDAGERVVLRVRPSSTGDEQKGDEQGIVAPTKEPLGRADSVAASAAAPTKAGPQSFRVWIENDLRQAAGRSYGIALRLLPWLWVCGFPLACAWILMGVAGAEKFRRGCCPLENEEWLSVCRRLAQQLRIRVSVRFAVSDRLALPLLIGIVRPLVLLPASAVGGYSPEQVEMVVLHELAHVRRWDNLVNFLQRLVEAVLFFHPSVWWLSQRVRLEREHCCDAVVLAHTGSPRRYAEFLARLALPGVFPQSALGVSAGEQLVTRIRHILNQENEPMKVSRSSVIALSAFFVALIAVAISSVHLKSSTTAAEMEEFRRIPRIDRDIRITMPLAVARGAEARPVGVPVAQASSPPVQEARTNAAPAGSRSVEKNGVAASPDGAKTIMEPASVQAFESVCLYALINGTVEKMEVEIGDPVKRGQILIKIAAPAVTADVMVNRAKVAEAQAELSQAKLALAPIEVEITKAEKEHRDADMSAAKGRLAIAQAATTTARARLEVAHMELRKAESFFEYTTLRAPIDGIVSRRTFQVGDVVFAGSSAASQPLLVIERTDRVRVIVRVPEQDVLQVEPGSPATVALDVFPGKTFSAKVARTRRVLDPTDRTMRVEIDLPNPNGQLMSGMFGRARITLKTPSQQN